MQPVLLALATSWPFCLSVGFIVLGGLALFLFRAQIGAFINRTRRFGGKRWGVDAPPEQKAPPPPEGTLLPAQAEAAPGPAVAGAAAPAPPDPHQVANQLVGQISTNAYVRAREAVITEFLTHTGVGADLAETRRVLIAIAASASVSLEFEQLYALIWGSQIAILTEINAAGAPVPHETIVAHYEAVVATLPLWYVGHSFDAYLVFLVGTGLIEPKDHGYTITLKGRTFLLYLIHEGKYLKKLG